MQPEAAKRLRLLASVLSVLLVVALLAVGVFFWRLRASLPQLDGRRNVGGLGAEVVVERDALGVPTVRAQNRADAARALGFLHAQDRFFQMDILRRSPAGELAEMFGVRAVPRDRTMRIHGFRHIAERVVAQMPPAQRAILDAYVGGVNAGLAALGARPFEYIVLRASPQPWRAEDSVLVIYAMTLDLQGDLARYEQSVMTLRDQFGTEGLAFFNPLVTPDDSALDGSTAPVAPIPPPKIIDLRAKKMVGPVLRTGLDSRHLAASDLPSPAGTQAGSESQPHREDSTFPFPPRDPEAAYGSNAFALAGAHTANGAGLLANDMHLDHGVPNIWYRAVLDYAGRRVVGATLPGAPAIVVGSNGDVAWGFTNACVDTGDLVELDPPGGLPTWYITPQKPDGIAPEDRHEVIRVKGGRDVNVDYPWTVWGPIVGKDERGKQLAFHWVAHDPAATNFALLDMEHAKTAADAVAVAHRAGIPAQNVVIADKAGNLAWTIGGRLPNRVGYDGRLPVPWAYGDRRWDGFLPPNEVPVVSSQPAEGARVDASAAQQGRIWSANQRHVGGPALAKLGDGDYSRPNRGGQIRDDLAKLEQATPKDLLAVQLDDRALFLEPWHKLMLEALSPAATDGHPPRAALRGWVEKWEGRASTDAIAYRLVREWRIAVYTRMFKPIFARCEEAMPDFPWNNFQLEPAAWTLLREKPMHLLDPQYASWDELLVAAADDVIHELDKQGVKLPYANWGWRNRARIRHPFGNLIPEWLGRYLNMPAEPLPGGDDMPRIQSPTHGASERMVVSPGHEEEGIFHMPGGQSAHPLSPFYRAGYEAWVRGEPTPLLPGKTEHTLRLVP